MDGPRKDAGVFLAGTDRVAVDAVGVAILKQLGSNDAIMKPAIFAQEQIARAVELGLGVASAAGHRHRDARRGERGLRGEDPGDPRGRLSAQSAPNGLSIETASRPPRCRAPFSVTTMQSSMRMPNSP